MPSDLEIALRWFETAKKIDFTDELLLNLVYRPDLLRSMFRVQTELSKLRMTQDSDSQKLAELLVTSIRDLEFSVRCVNSLGNSGISTLGDLVRETEGQMLARKTFAKKTVQEIVYFLESQSLNFGMVFEIMDGGIRVTDWGTPPIRILSSIPDEDEEEF